jgi:hypothetical protein
LSVAFEKSYPIFLKIFQSTFLPRSAKHKVIKSKIMPIEKAIVKGSQIGELTHHQDQSILPVNLRTRKTINKTTESDIPDLEDDFAIVNIFENKDTKYNLIYNNSYFNQ